MDQNVAKNRYESVEGLYDRVGRCCAFIEVEYSTHMRWSRLPKTSLSTGVLTLEARTQRISAWRSSGNYRLQPMFRRKSLKSRLTGTAATTNFILFSVNIYIFQVSSLDWNGYS